MDVTQVKLPISLAFAATRHTWYVGKGEPKSGEFYSRSPLRIGGFGGQGLVLAGSRIAVGDWVWPGSIGGQPRPFGDPKVVEAIDETTRADSREWLIEWAQVPAPREPDPRPAVVLDPERFAHIMIAWIYERTGGGQSTADLSDFAPGDIPLDCAISLAELLRAAGLLERRGSGTVSLTEQGAAAAREAAADRANKTRCTEALQNGIIQWLYEKDDPNQFVDMHDILYDARSTFRGRFFTDDELAIEVSYLIELGFIHDDPPWWALPTLTAKGRICAAYHGGNVHESLNPQPTPPSPTIINLGSNNQNAVGAAQQTVYAPPPAPAAATPSPESAATNATLETPAVPTWRQKLGRFGTRANIVIGTVCAIVIAVFTVLAYFAITAH